MIRKDFNDTLKEILNGKFDEEEKNIIMEKEIEEKKERNIDLERIKIMEQIGIKFYQTFCIFFPSIYYNDDVVGKGYSIRCSRNFFIIFIDEQETKIKTKYDSNRLIYYNKEDKIYEADLEKLEEIKYYFNKIKEDLIEMTKKERDKLEKENLENEAFLKLLVEKVSNW